MSARGNCCLDQLACTSDVPLAGAQEQRHSCRVRATPRSSGADMVTAPARGIHHVQEWTTPQPSKRPDIIPDLDKLETPIPVKLPGDPEQPEDEEWEEDQKKRPDTDPEKEPPEWGEEGEEDDEEKKKKEEKEKEEGDDDDDEDDEGDGLAPKPSEE